MSEKINSKMKFAPLPVILTFEKKVKEPVEGTKQFQKVSKTIYHNCDTGKEGFEIKDVIGKDEPYTLFKWRRSLYRGFAIQYDEAENCLMFIYATFEPISIKEEGVRAIWKERFRFYVTPDKRFFSKAYTWGWENGRYELMQYTDSVLYERDFVPFEFKMYKDINQNVNPNIKVSNSIDAFHKVFPEIVTIAGNRMVATDNATNIIAFFKYVEPKKKPTKAQQRVDELTKYELSDVNSESFKCTFEDTLNRYAVIEKVQCDDPWCVLRTYSSTNNGNLTEGARIYIGKNEVVACKKTNAGEFIQMPLLSKPEHWKFHLQDFPSDVSKGTMLEYYTSILPSLSEDARSNAIWAFIKWPIFEQLSKIGGLPFVNDILKDYRKNPMEHLQHYFGTIDETGKNIYQKLGLNKNQLKKFLENPKALQMGVAQYRIVRFIKRVVTNNISSYSYYENAASECYCMSIMDIDDNTFNTLYDIGEKFCSVEINRLYVEGRNFDTCCIQLYHIYGFNTLRKMSDKLLSLFLGESRTRGAFTTLDYYADYINMVNMYEDSVNFRPYFETREDIINMHDAISLVHATKKQQVDIEKFEARKTVWKKFVYSDDEYSVIAPNNPSEIALEGLTLRHCVKSYIRRVTDGTTNILFLRKNSDIGEPFFTIEISNSGEVEQIHGFANRNIDTEPELDEFVTKWIKEKKLNEKNFNKIR